MNDSLISGVKNVDMIYYDKPIKKKVKNDFLGKILIIFYQNNNVSYSQV